MRWKYALAGLLLLTAGILGTAEINDLETVDASNTARFPENMAPSAVNDGFGQRLCACRFANAAGLL